MSFPKAKMATGLKLVCIVASVREGRMADRMIKLVKQQFAEVLKPAGHTLVIIGM